MSIQKECVRCFGARFLNGLVTVIQSPYSPKTSLSDLRAPSRGRAIARARHCAGARLVYRENLVPLALCNNAGYRVLLRSLAETSVAAEGLGKRVDTRAKIAS